jgi:hypothetical protein
MKKFILIGFMLICAFQNKTTAQTSAATTAAVHEYYLLVNGVNNADETTAFEKLLATKKGVISVSHKDAPILHIVVSSTVPMSYEELQKWLSGSKYELRFITEDPKGKNKLDGIKPKK